MAKRGTYVGGSTVFGPGSNWFGSEPEEAVAPLAPEPFSFQKLIRESASSTASGRSGFDIQREALRQERKAVDKATWKPDAVSETPKTFLVEVKRPRRTLAPHRRKIEGDDG